MSFSLSPSQQRLIPRRPSGGLLRWAPPADSSGGRQPMSSPGFQGPACRCAAGGTWLGCGLRGVGDGVPRDCPWVPDASTGVAWRMVSAFLLALSKPYGFFRHTCPWSKFYRCPYLTPPPLPLPRTTVRVPLPSLWMEEYFHGRSARPHPAGPGLPVGFLKPVPVRVLLPPSLLLGPHHQGPVAP